jgi:hypothetical protein
MDTTAVLIVIFVAGLLLYLWHRWREHQIDLNCSLAA